MLLPLLTHAQIIFFQFCLASAYLGIAGYVVLGQAAGQAVRWPQAFSRKRPEAEGLAHPLPLNNSLCNQKRHLPRFGFTLAIP